MPRKTTKSPRTTTTSGAKLPDFVSCELTQDEKVALKKAVLSATEVVDLLEGLQNEGYRVAISHDSRSDCVGLYVTAIDPDHENYGLALSARGPDLSSACTVLSFKHYHKLGEDWSNGTGVAQRDNWG